MKITLHNPPYGYEAEAETKLRIYAREWFLDYSGHAMQASVEMTTPGSYGYFIKLTQKKRKYWRFDQVKTFEEATPGQEGLLSHGLCSGLLGTYSKNTDHVMWLKMTEHEE